MPGLPAPIDIVFDGTPNGPTATQLEAASCTVRCWDSLIRDAVEGLAALLAEAELPIPDDVWEAFDVIGITVPADSYDPSGAVHVLIDLAHVDHPDDFLPAIDVVDGRVVEVLSGT